MPHEPKQLRTTKAGLAGSTQLQGGKDVVAMVESKQKNRLMELAKNEVAEVQPRFVRLAEACKIVGIQKTRTYELLNEANGRIKTLVLKSPTGNDRGSEKTQNSNSNSANLADASTKIKWGSQFPILRGFRIRNQIAVHCPWCDRMHFHGWNAQDSSRVVTLRIAHGGHEAPAPSSYCVSVFRQEDLRKLGYSPVKRRRARIGSSHKREGSMELTPRDGQDENETAINFDGCPKKPDVAFSGELPAIYFLAERNRYYWFNDHAKAWQRSTKGNIKLRLLQSGYDPIPTLLRLQSEYVVHAVYENLPGHSAGIHIRKGKRILVTSGKGVGQYGS